MIPRKPAWLKRSAWNELLNANIGSMHCCGCGCHDGLTVDHIVPRVMGGTNAVSNLQFMCRSCNSSKGARPDKYWERSFYFDNKFEPEAFRSAQRLGALDQIYERREWFTMPYSQISGVLYCANWIVGSGKSLGMLALAFGMNRASRSLGYTAPRIDKMLIITKETAIRDQIALALGGDPLHGVESEVVKYGICKDAPVVRVAKDADFWDSVQEQQCDIVVTCLQQLWSLRPLELHRILSQFPMISMDEIHWAQDKILQIVNAATQSVCFGMTGTPIEGSGALLENIYTLSIYDYDDANANDGSLKFISDKLQYRSDIIDVIGITDATIKLGDRTRSTHTTDEEGYSQSLVAAKSVLERTIRRMVEMDQRHTAQFADDFKCALHRVVGTYKPDYVYRLCGMVVVDTVQKARELCKYANEMFDRDRETYPLEAGYRAEYVCSEDVVGTRRPLTPKHPWMLMKRTGGLTTDPETGEHAARLLVVVGIGREGVDNPYCGVVGIACKTLSLIELVQRPIGRQLRAMVRRVGDVLHVPPHLLDTAWIVTHAAFDMEDKLQQALKYVCHMREYLSDIPTIDDLISEAAEGELPKNLKAETFISMAEKNAIISRIGSDILTGGPVSVEEIPRAYGNGNSDRCEKVREFVDDVLQRPDVVEESMGYRSELRAIQVIMRESPTAAPDLAAIEAFMQTVPALAPMIPVLRCDDGQMRNVALVFATDSYSRHVKQFHTGSIKPSTTLSAISNAMAGEVWDAISHAHEPKSEKIPADVYRLVNLAIRMTFAVPPKKTMKDLGEWDTAQHHAVLYQPAVRKAIIGWVIRKLMANGSLPTMAAAFGGRYVVDAAV